MACELVVVEAVSLCVRLRRLAAREREVVIEAEVPGAVVVLQQHPLTWQRPPQVCVLVQTGERRVIGLVLENDQPHMLDLARPDPEAIPGCHVPAWAMR